VAIIDTNDVGELRRIEARLIVRFCPPLHPDDVRRCIADGAARYESAKVRGYISLLIERQAAEQLRAMANR
jgi:hypothetical protein